MAAGWGSCFNPRARDGRDIEQIVEGAAVYHVNAVATQYASPGTGYLVLRQRWGRVVVRLGGGGLRPGHLGERQAEGEGEEVAAAHGCRLRPTAQPFSPFLAGPS